MTDHNSNLAGLAMSVWPTAQQTARTQRGDRYLPEAVTHPGKMLPAIARHAISAYSAPGELVCDPMCGIGTTLIEAIHLGRQAVGVEYEARWAELARANLTHATAAPGTGRVLVGDARRLPELVDRSLHGRVALVLTSPPYGASLHGQITARPGAGVTKAHYRYSHDPTNLAHIGLSGLLAAMSEVLTGCAVLLRPGGTVAMTVRPYRHDGALVDLPGALLRTGQHAGLIPVERNAALLAGLRGDRLVPRASFFQLDYVRRARRVGVPLQVIAHEDLLVWRRPRN